MPRITVEIEFDFSSQHVDYQKYIPASFHSPGEVEDARVHGGRIVFNDTPMVHIDQLRHAIMREYADELRDEAIDHINRLKEEI